MIEPTRAVIAESSRASDVAKVIERVQTVVTECLNVEVPSVDTDLLENGMLDSLALVNLLLTIEQKFGVSVSLEDMDFEQWRSIRAISAFLVSSLSAAGLFLG